MEGRIVSGGSGLRRESFVRVSVYTPLAIGAIKGQSLMTAGDLVSAMLHTVAGAAMTLTLVLCLALCSVILRRAAPQPSVAKGRR